MTLAQRPTIASGDVIAADLMVTNRGDAEEPGVRPGDPDRDRWRTVLVPCGFKAGAVQRLQFKMDRTGAIKQIGQESDAPTATTPIDKSDPWSN